MKKTLLTLAVVLLAVVAQAQTSIKVHDNSQISFQSATTSNGIQFFRTGEASFEPNITTAYDQATGAKLRSLLTKAWVVKLNGNVNLPSDSFYVYGNGNVFAYGSYLTYSPIRSDSKDSTPIEGASELVSSMNGYYMDSNEFEGIEPEDIENNGNVFPEALDGLLNDLEKGRIIGMYGEELEAILPEAVRHDPEGGMAINYDAVVTVLVEAFKEQQARISQLEAILEENGLMKAKKP